MVHYDQVKKKPGYNDQASLYAKRSSSTGPQTNDSSTDPPPMTAQQTPLMTACIGCWPTNKATNICPSDSRPGNVTTPGAAPSSGHDFLQCRRASCCCFELQLGQCAQVHLVPHSSMHQHITAQHTNTSAVCKCVWCRNATAYKVLVPQQVLVMCACTALAGLYWPPSAAIRCTAYTIVARQHLCNIGKLRALFGSKPPHASCWRK